MKINKKLFWTLNAVFFAAMAVFAILYIVYNEYGLNYDFAGAFKYTASALFVVEGVANFLLAKSAGAKTSTFPIAVIVGLVLCLVGDVVINYMFVVGMVFFALGHISLIVSFTRANIFGWKHILPFVAFALFSLLMIFLYPSFDFGNMLAYVVIYAIAISLMVGMAIGVALDGTVDPKVRALTVSGAVLFYASDFCLTLRQFATGGRAADILCLTLYYLAMFIIALLPAVYPASGSEAQKAEMNVFKRLWCRAYQFVFKIVIPFLPYKNPTILSSCDDAALLLENQGKKKPLIVTDKGIVACGLVEPVAAALDRRGIPYEVYSDTVVNPTIQNAEEAAKLYRDSDCDCLIAIGGGSAMDCAKACGVRILKPNRSFSSMKGVLKVFGKLPLLIAVPTTSGTGSETTIAAVIVDEKTRDKFTIIDFCLQPRYALLDPVMTRGLPKSLTSTTGMDALTHAVEAYIGGSTTKRTRTLAVDAVKTIKESLYAAYENGDDMEARRKMQHAAYSAGMAFTISYVGYVHAVAHSLGGRYNTAHGLANSVILPYVLRDYGKYAKKKLAKLSRLSGVSDADASDETACEEFISWIEDLRESMNIPKTLRVDREDIPALAAHADKEANPLYPVPYLMNAKNLEKIYLEIRDASGDENAPTDPAGEI